MADSAQTILHIDDNESNRYIVGRILRNAGFTLIEAASGETGLQALATHRPDLVILDVKLPGLNGFQVCRQIKANPDTSMIPVLHLSASFIKGQDKAAGLDSGADAYLAQPIEPVELVATVRSLLRIRRAEETALMLAREWQTTFDSISDGIGLLDRKGRFLRCNQAMAHLLGKSFSEILNQHYSDLTLTALGFGDGTCFTQTQITLRREGMELEARDRWFAKTIDPVLDKQGQFSGAVFILADITPRKQIEAELSQLLAREQAARSQAEAANRMKDEFLATLSHELRSPLNAMLGWLRLLNTRQFDTETTKKAMETIERNARAQAQLVEDLLDVSRIIQGKLRLQVRPIELTAVIEAAIGTVQPSAEAKNIRLQSVLDPAAGPIAGDSDRLQQVVWNLLSNAVKFTAKGGRVLIRLERVNSHVEVVITDTGQGIAPEFVPFVFDRFRQEDSSTTRAFGGLGLGLAIVRHLVELHGGTVQVESPGIGQGASFTVRLPLIPVRLEPTPIASVHPAIARTAPSEVPLLTGVRILVVDDEKDAREFLRAMLELLGAEVTVTASASQAIAALAQITVDVLVSDIGMPDEDGYSLIRKLRGLPVTQGSETPAIALTAYARVDDRLQALAAGFQMHLSKPVEPAELATVIASLARLGKRE